MVLPSLRSRTSQIYLVDWSWESMPVVKFYETVPSQDGTIPARGTISFVPTQPVFLDPVEQMLPKAFNQEMVDGVVEADLASTDGWAWKVSIYYGTRNHRSVGEQVYYVAVPDVDGPINWSDLEHVDPNSLSSKPLEPLWKIEINRLKAKIRGLEKSITTPEDPTEDANPIPVDPVP